MQDLFGERIVLIMGLALTATAAYGAALEPQSMLAGGVALFGGGMAAASANTASGRLVTGWFPAEQRGLAMGIRQTAQPPGIASAALVLPELGKRSISVALLFPATVCALSALLCAVWVRCGCETRRGRHGRPPTTASFPVPIAPLQCCGEPTWRLPC
ncbi:putative MFS-type transporter [Mycobacterium innocens]|uniref:Putative MFS-type transporter n=1 Tax=Mycobacterium innocens TaxID=2341083 RepID=A0A498PY91_9MYCO|nr:MFS transporter [Mycobacterium innocens]VBA37202.1 putative MFS-type transporter [Mycobacterium innocens]